MYAALSSSSESPLERRPLALLDPEAPLFFRESDVITCAGLSEVWPLLGKVVWEERVEWLAECFSGLDEVVDDELRLSPPGLDETGGSTVAVIANGCVVDEKSRGVTFVLNIGAGQVLLCWFPGCSLDRWAGVLMGRGGVE